MSVQERIEGLQERIQTARKESEDRTVEAVRKVAERLGDVELPFSDRLPEPRDLATRYFDYVEKRLASQRQFAFRLLDAASPAVKKSRPAAKAA